MKNKEYILLILGIILLIISIVLKANIPTKESSIENMTEMTLVNEENKESYFYPETILDNIGNLYIVYKGNDSVFLLISDELKEEFSSTPFDGRRYKVVGTSKQFNSEQKNSLVKYNNDKYFYSMGSQITLDEVDDIFGKYYLDVEKIVDDWTIGSVNKQISNVLLEIGVASMIVGIIFIVIKKYESGD